MQESVHKLTTTKTELLLSCPPKENKAFQMIFSQTGHFYNGLYLNSNQLLCHQEVNGK